MSESIQNDENFDVVKALCRMAECGFQITITDMQDNMLTSTVDVDN